MSPYSPYGSGLSGQSIADHWRRTLGRFDQPSDRPGAGETLVGASDGNIQPKYVTVISGLPPSPMPTAGYKDVDVTLPVGVASSPIQRVSAYFYKAGAVLPSGPATVAFVLLARVGTATQGVVMRVRLLYFISESTDYTVRLFIRQAPPH